MKILLTTLHAKYSHASLALPCLAACCQDLARLDITLREWTVNEPHEQLLRQVIAEQADLVAFSCYIWNIEKTLRLVADIRKVAPETLIVLGGPEVSFGTFELMHAHPAVDFVIKGEGEGPFRRLLQTLASTPSLPGHHEVEQFAALWGQIDNLFFRDQGDTVSGPLTEKPMALDAIPSPFLAGLADLKRPLTYYETSRGCPFSCAFCLSSVEGGVRSFSPERIESDLDFLLQHGVAQIKLVDRTFNFDPRRANRIWSYILEHNRGSHFHFEIAADLLTEENLCLLRQAPPDTFRFEIGIQSISRETLERVQRRADLARICGNVRRLRKETAVEVHLDLVAGLPGESYGGLLDSLQQVHDLDPHVIQIEPLKVLKGSPMREIARREGYRFSDAPPYTILTTPWLSFDEIGRIETIGRLLDLFHNRGGFTAALNFMVHQLPAAALFDRMARQVGHQSLVGRTTRRQYELFAQLAGALVPVSQLHLLYDALFFDYCQQEMPLLGRLPAFIADRQQHCSWPGRQELPAGLDLPPGSRIKAFRYPFAQRYPGAPGATVTFVYASAEGRGLQVRLA